MALAGWIAVTALLIAAIALVARNYLQYLHGVRMIHTLADHMHANFEHKPGKDFLTWRKSDIRATLSLHRTALGLARIEAHYFAHDRQQRPPCRMVKRPGETVLGSDEIDTDPHALGHRRFDKIARILGIANTGVKERLLAENRADVLVRLFRFGFEDVEFTRETVTACRFRPTTPETLTKEAVTEWFHLLSAL